jgi:ribosomal-protein-alanine N-acetyltransferase
MSDLQTPRLTLRRFVPGDVDALYRIFCNPAVTKFIGDGQPANHEETAVALDSIIRHWHRHGFGRWAITDRATDELIGCGGLRSLFGTPELVYLFAEELWGRGLATEVATAILEYGFREKGFERIVAITKPGNTASIRVMQKLGMRFEMDANYYGFEVVQYTIDRDGFTSAGV